MAPASRPDGRCPCGSGNTYDDCCGRVHLGVQVAPTAEALMRSRFCAYAIGDADYVLSTWHSTTRPASLELDPDLRWLHLEILAVSGGLFDDVAYVEFSARYRTPAGRGSLRERSRFVREHGRWFYVEGDVRSGS